MDSNNMFTNNNDDMYKKIRSSLMINRILLIANLVFVTVLLIGAGFVGYKGKLESLFAIWAVFNVLSKSDEYIASNLLSLIFCFIISICS